MSDKTVTERVRMGQEVMDMVVIAGGLASQFGGGVGIGLALLLVSEFASDVMGAAIWGIFFGYVTGTVLVFWAVVRLASSVLAPVVTREVVTRTEERVVPVYTSRG